MNTLKKLDIAVLIGRFQPFHTGHAALLSTALDSAKRVVIVLGSSYKARSSKNPFTWQEREAMIKSTLTEEVKARVSFIPVRDYYDDVKWSETIIQSVQATSSPTEKDIGLIGFKKDASSYYLNLFKWDLIEATEYGRIDATIIRQLYFESEHQSATDALFSNMLPTSIQAYLKGWMLLPPYQEMKDEYFSVKESKRKYGTGPFITVDAILTTAEQVLLVKRKHSPGNGLWAIPGGFLELRERLLQGAIRELKEETQLALLDDTIKNHLKSVVIFDHVDRSTRGRTITHAHWFDFGDTKPFEVSGADDAAEAKWIHIADLDKMEELFFEDHFTILKKFIG
jgi:bifunctional NMN adenylyltransferase/nudix hydrolase